MRRGFTTTTAAEKASRFRPPHSLLERPRRVPLCRLKKFAGERKNYTKRHSPHSPHLLKSCGRSGCVLALSAWLHVLNQRKISLSKA